MRIFLLACLAVFISSCNSSAKKDPNQAMDDTARRKDPNQAMDDTARMHDPNHVVVISTTKLAVTDIPAAIKIKGQVQEACKWNDNLGTNIFITSYVAPYNDRDEEQGEDAKTAAIYAYHYVIKGDDYREVWMLKEEEKECAFDITTGFIPGSTTVTDLDKDGIAEMKVQYIKACRSDVSPAVMKLALYENGVKYSLVGNTWVYFSPEFQFNVTPENVNLSKQPKLQDEMEEMLRAYGRYENENQFVSAPPSFLNYARKEWLKYVKEKMGE